MPRPKHKTDLIRLANERFHCFWEEVDSLAAEQFNAEFDFSDLPNLTEAHWSRDKNVRDIVIHLYEWHQLLLNCIQQNLERKNLFGKGTKPIKFLPEPYTFKNLAELNFKFWKQHQTTSFNDAKTLLQQSHQQVMKLIESFNNDELFTKQYFDWTGTTTLGSYCISATSSHYDWAIKKLKKHKKYCKG